MTMNTHTQKHLKTNQCILKLELQGTKAKSKASYHKVLFKVHYYIVNLYRTLEPFFLDQTRGSLHRNVQERLYYQKKEKKKDPPKKQQQPVLGVSLITVVFHQGLRESTVLLLYNKHTCRNYFDTLLY